jgi:small subunit ribosomal protein S15
MAKLHSKKKGKSGTKRAKARPSQVVSDIGKEEAKLIILKMVREEVPPARIGLLLRDKHGVASLRALLGVSLTKFLKAEKALPEYPEDMVSLIKKAVKLRGHLKTFKGDTHNRVKLSHIESKINRLVKYYVSRKRLPATWRYDHEKAALLVK